MPSDFSSVEAELRDIEEAFASGRMNAFGSAFTQDAFVHELKRIAEIETQVFYRTCALLKSSNTNEHTLVTNMYASAQPPSSSQRAGPATMPPSGGVSDGSVRVGTSGMESSMHRGSMSPGSHSPLVPVVPGGRGGMSPATGNSLSAGGSRRQSRYGQESISGAYPFSGLGDGGGSSGAAPHIHQGEWGNEDGFADQAFEDVAAHFDDLESQFYSLGDFLREISKHVIRLNDMSKQVNSSVNGGAAAAVNVNECGTTTDMPQRLSGLGWQDRPDPFADAIGSGSGAGYRADRPPL
ncbi:hypothetical protein LSCM1_05877 [Leishmania martiniquensis]|uniref:Uncharacterized protein n=1 Tax=Leishmania martiniquensis TaxID=1580590 RepID=A0A836KV79_9TRYP|nr:hypothetical protein LSCM1_05877 [Leishmania martiniquensis]